MKKTFQTSGTLRAHVKWIHEEHNQVECHICKRTFKNRKNMGDHIRNIHPKKQESKYKCDMCEIEFTRKSSQIKHLENVHIRKKMLYVNFVIKHL